MTTPEDLPDRVTDEPYRVLMRGRLAPEVVCDVAHEGTPGYGEFADLFEIVKGPGGRWLAKEDYYQGLTCTAVIRRRADGALFGYPFWEDISKNGDGPYIQSNGDEFGMADYGDYRDEWCLPGAEDGDEADDLNEVYVWLPVEAFLIMGYRIPGATA